MQHVIAVSVALAGGVFGILGAIYNELLQQSLFAAFVAAPIIEEMLKPSGVYLLLARWPWLLRSRIYTACLSALSGIAFALIENLFYLYIYVESPTAELIMWRYTACVGIHTVCSFIFGFGINQKLLASIKGDIAFLSYGKRFFFTAMALHSLYNISMVILQI